MSTIELWRSELNSAGFGWIQSQLLLNRQCSLRPQSGLEKNLALFAIVETFLPLEFMRQTGVELLKSTTPVWRINSMLMAKLTADLVYSRLAPGVLEELRRMAPKDEKGRRKAKLFQGLTTDIGHPALKDHVAGLTFLAKTHRENEWGTFYDAVNRAAPQFGKTMLLPLSGESHEEPDPDKE